MTPPASSRALLTLLAAAAIQKTINAEGTGGCDAQPPGVCDGHSGDNSIGYF